VELQRLTKVKMRDFSEVVPDFGKVTRTISSGLALNNSWAAIVPTKTGMVPNQPLWMRSWPAEHPSTRGRDKLIGVLCSVDMFFGGSLAHPLVEQKASIWRGDRMEPQKECR